MAVSLSENHIRQMDLDMSILWANARSSTAFFEIPSDSAAKCVVVLRLLHDKEMTFVILTPTGTFLFLIFLKRKPEKLLQ
jgi:hypothetical protein